MAVVEPEEMVVSPVTVEMKAKEVPVESPSVTVSAAVSTVTAKVLPL